MSDIIEWPYSQICTDCQKAFWLKPNEKHSLTYPAAICTINHYPEGTDCSNWEHQHKSIELISAGYEWTCAACNQLNKTIEIKSIVKCQQCQREYAVDNYEHAYQK
jgi:hypothetical protein